VKAGPSFQAWLGRRLDEGADLDRVERQIKAWRECPPNDTNAALFDAMLAELDKARGAKKAPAPKPVQGEAGAFD
jgi:hypothetical protein